MQRLPEEILGQSCCEGQQARSEEASYPFASDISLRPPSPQQHRHASQKQRWPEKRNDLQFESVYSVCGFWSRGEPAPRPKAHEPGFLAHLEFVESSALVRLALQSGSSSGAMAVTSSALAAVLSSCSTSRCDCHY
ncbi:hypothetical protein M0R45_031044 [Rubus argutus]|uniref:Uncharacterized protein n=1 Tax=Rubus argutus TaxID=59490 RepID=A0AAW1WCS1_RUBAR